MISHYQELNHSSFFNLFGLRAVLQVHALVTHKCSNVGYAHTYFGHRMYSKFITALFSAQYLCNSADWSRLDEIKGWGGGDDVRIT